LFWVLLSYFSTSEIEKVDFFRVNFNKNTNFSESRLKEVKFTETKFFGLTDFSKVFFDEVKFTKAEIKEIDFSKSQFNGPTFFNVVSFKDQDMVFFEVDDLSKVSFMFTDVSKVRFGENVKWAGKNGFQIMDEESLKNSSDTTRIESVIAIYRNLRKNYENRYRFEEAGKFFEREIELRKMFLDKCSDFSNGKLENLEKKLHDLLKELNELKKKSDDSRGFVP